jgi:hypothetical protein
VAWKKTAQRPSYLPKTWAAKREQPPAQVARNVREAAPEMPSDDLDVPTFLRRQAQKA